MNNLTKSRHQYLRPASIAILIKTVGFWACFWLVLNGLQLLPLPPISGTVAPIVASITIVAILVLIFGLLKIDGGSRHDIGLSFPSKSLLQFVIGIGFGIVVVAIMISALILLTPLEIEASADSEVLAVLGASFVILFVLALMEELAFRSYPLFRLRQAWGIRPAVYVTSIAFALYHGIAFDNLLGPGVWGLFFGWMAISTNSIALPTGFHLGLNWLQALVGMKPQYGASIWELSIGPSSGFIDVETLGFLMQVGLLIAGIFIVENLVSKQGKST